MRTEILILIFLILLLITYFILVRGERKKISILNSDGSKISLDVEFANSTATSLKGLMGRSSLDENSGMLFIFDRPGTYGFWMLNTTIPLEAIHFNENFTVVDIVEMKPCGLNVIACKTYYPKEFSLYVLEVNSGFSKKHGVEIGKSRLKLEN